MKIICDIDGTLSVVGDRRRLILIHRPGHVPPEAWEEFHARCGEDDVRYPLAQLLRELYLIGHSILLMTGRPEAYRERTVAWLSSNRIPYNQLLMRGNEDRRPDYELKRFWYEAYIGRHEAVLGVFEDRPSVVAMWRELGLCCFALPDASGEIVPEMPVYAASKVEPVGYLSANEGAT